MKNLVQASPTNDGPKYLELTAPSNVVSGQFLLIGTIPCVAVAAVASGAKGTFLVEQVISYTKATATFAEGDPVYWDVSEGKMDDTSDTGTNKVVGLALKDDDGIMGVTFKMLPEARA